jgi:peptidoglycan/LPS O-acetylase OafA/YrhL
LSYCIRRFFRLYPAVLFSIAFALATALFIYPIAQTWRLHNTDWIFNTFTDALAHKSPRFIFLNLALIHNDLNSPLWTIRVEFICSLLLPFVILIVRNNIGVLVAMTLASGYIFWKVFDLDLTYNLLGILGYLFPFLLGYMISVYTPSLALLSRKNTEYLLSGLALGLFAACVLKSYLAVCCILALALAVLVPCNNIRIRNFLESNPLQFLGKISFSFYLLNTPIILCIYTAMSYLTPKILIINNGFIPGLIIFIISVTVTIPISALSERFVEVPFNNMGHRLSKLCITGAFPS